MFQEQTQISPTIFAIVLTGISLAVTIVGTLGGFGYRILNNRITEVREDVARNLHEAKADIRESITNEERRRMQEVAGLAAVMANHYELLRNDLRDMKSELKTDIRNHVR